ncbi:MAG: hypothetical protein V1754_04280, partial [Pseudomonadota bacterium]
LEKMECPYRIPDDARKMVERHQDRLEQEEKNAQQLRQKMWTLETRTGSNKQDVSNSGWQEKRRVIDQLGRLLVRLSEREQARSATVDNKTKLIFTVLVPILFGLAAFVIFERFFHFTWPSFGFAAAASVLAWLLGLRFRRRISTLSTDDLHQEIDRLSRELGFDKIPSEEELDILAIRLDEQKKAADEQKKSTEENLRVARELEVIKQNIEKETRAIDDLLERSGVAKGESRDIQVQELFRREKVQIQRGELEREIAVHKRAVESMAGIGNEGKEILKTLQDGSPTSWRIALQETERDVELLDQERVKLSEQIGTLDSQLDKMEQDTLVSDCLEKREALRNEVINLAKEWSVLTLTLWLLRQVREKQERERQPEVIRCAESVFNQMTQGRYPHLLAPFGEKQVDVEDRNGGRKDLSKLSRGTREQLLLALRLAIVEDLSHRSVALPLIMDDVLVNFDPARASAFTKTLVEFAAQRKQQVIVFTCHPETVDLFCSLDSTTPIFSLEKEDKTSCAF